MRIINDQIIENKATEKISIRTKFLSPFEDLKNNRFNLNED